jgi:hypothetical protein
MDPFVGGKYSLPRDWVLLIVLTYVPICIHVIFLRLEVTQKHITIDTQRHHMYTLWYNHSQNRLLLIDSNIQEGIGVYASRRRGKQIKPKKTPGKSQASPPIILQPSLSSSNRIIFLRCSNQRTSCTQPSPSPSLP